LNRTSVTSWRRAGALLAAVGVASWAWAPAVLGQSPPTRVGRQPDHSVILQTGQRITPIGRQVELKGRPVAVAIRPGGRTAAVLAGTGLFGGRLPLVSVLDLATGKVIQEFNPTNEGASFAGLAYSPDGSRLYASQADGLIATASVAADGSLSDTGPIPVVRPGLGCTNHLAATLVTARVPDHPTANPYPGGMAVSSDGKTLYVALSCRNSLGVIDLTTRLMVAEIPVGNAPHAVQLVGTRAYVTNQGGRPARPGDRTNLSGGTPVVVDRDRGMANTGTISVVDLLTRRQTSTIAVGLQPTELLLSGSTLFVTNTNSDSVSAIDTRTNRVLTTFGVNPTASPLRGFAPNALAMLPGNELAVSLGRANAVAVFQWQPTRRQASLTGLLPTGGYPAALVVDTARKRLLVGNNHGVGALGPTTTNSLRVPPSQAKGHSTYATVGTVSLMPYPTRTVLQDGAAQVARDNGWSRLRQLPPRRGVTPVPVPAREGEPSVIKHVVYVVKENRTYDQVLSDDPRGNGDPSLLEFGQGVTPNHHAISRRWSLFDNFYANGEVSADGHQWATMADEGDYLEKSGANPLGRSYPFDGGDALVYLPTGFLWENATKHGKSVRMFGEYANQTNPTRSDVPSADRLMNREFWPFDLSVSDQDRADAFLREFDTYVQRKNMPNLVIMTLSQDHTIGSTPDKPTPAAQMADNDLALGRVLDAISHSTFWKDTAVFVVEDDAQGGVDHVDGNRTVALVASPWASRHQVDSRLYTQLNMVRTMEVILGLPPMNLMDRAAEPMYDAFTDRPDTRPYDALRPPATTLTSKNAGLDETSSPLARQWAEAASRLDFRTPDVEANKPLLNHDVWYATHGYHTPYPGDDHVLSPAEVSLQARLAAVKSTNPAGAGVPARSPRNAVGLLAALLLLLAAAHRRRV
jgi:YVTN family beta-propeller protein